MSVFPEKSKEGSPTWWVRVLAEALDRLDPDNRYRTGRRRPHTRAEYEDLRTVQALLRELKGVTNLMVRDSEVPRGTLREE